MITLKISDLVALFSASILVGVAAYYYGYWRGGQYVLKQIRDKWR